MRRFEVILTSLFNQLLKYISLFLNLFQVKFAGFANQISD
jgi:hypothetical protein